MVQVCEPSLLGQDILFWTQLKVQRCRTEPTGLKTALHRPTCSKHIEGIEVLLTLGVLSGWDVALEEGEQDEQDKQDKQAWKGTPSRDSITILLRPEYFSLSPPAQVSMKLAMLAACKDGLNHSRSGQEANVSSEPCFTLFFPRDFAASVMTLTWKTCPSTTNHAAKQMKVPDMRRTDSRKEVSLAATLPTLLSHLWELVPCLGQNRHQETLHST